MLKHEMEKLLNLKVRMVVDLGMGKMTGSALAKTVFNIKIHSYFK
jgi:hypothetical protein